MKIKLCVANFFLQAASCFLWVTNLNKKIFELQVVFYELKIESLILRIFWVESLRLNCFLQVEHLRYQFTNYQHMFESNFKEINLCKLCDKAVLIKWTLTLDNWDLR